MWWKQNMLTVVVLSVEWKANWSRKSSSLPVGLSRRLTTTFLAGYASSVFYTRVLLLELDIILMVFGFIVFFKVLLFFYLWIWSIDLIAPILYINAIIPGVCIISLLYLIVLVALLNYVFWHSIHAQRKFWPRTRRKNVLFVLKNSNKTTSLQGFRVYAFTIRGNK